MDIEGSPRTIVTVPRKLVNVSVPYLSVGGYVGNHLPLPAWWNDNWVGCSICGIGHDGPCQVRSYSRLADH